MSVDRELGAHLNQTTTGIAIVGCGYIADTYRYCLTLNPQGLRLSGIFDHDPERLASFAKQWGDRAYPSLRALLDDPTVAIVVNLTPPESHAEVTQAAIAAGKHVYSEKPLAMTAAQASGLRDRARKAGVRLASAPCNHLGESAQTVWAAVRSGRIGRVRLVYAELDDGMIHRADYRNWLSRSGRPWPARNEFETGCTFEHAGYALSILVSMFGPVRKVTSYAALLIADKGTEPPLAHPAPDFSVGLLEFDDGVVARVTNSIIAPYEHRMLFVGDEGEIEMRELWDYNSPVILRQMRPGRLSRFLERKGVRLGKRLAMVRDVPFRRGLKRMPKMEFTRGVAELAEAINENRACRLSEDLAVHITEVTEMLQHPERFSQPATVKSTFAAITPMPWA